MDNNFKSAVLIIVALIVGIIGGYYFGSNQGYTSGYETARGEISTRLVDKGVVQAIPKQLLSISGTIKSIANNQFVLDSQIPYDPTLPDSAQKQMVTRTVLVTPATEITIRSVVQNTAKPKANEPFSPFIVTNTKTNFSSLKVGDQVSVGSVVNILNKTTFEASSIFKNAQ